MNYDMMRKAYRITVSGKVQGVWYRASTKKMAEDLGIMGSVRNLPNGSVEILAEGPSEALGKMVNWCLEGPKAARVDHIVIKEQAVQSYHAFSILDP